MQGLKILFLAANPTNTEPLMLDKEIREITQKVKATTHRNMIEVKSAWAVTVDDLLQLLNEHRPEIVHFSGHGETNGIILADDNRDAKLVPTTALRVLFQTVNSVRVVLLNTCFSRIQAEAISDVVDCVIGMNLSISDKAAIVFAASFYSAIGFGKSVKEAFKQGKVALLLKDIPESSTPELLCKSDAASLYLITPSDAIKHHTPNLSVLYQIMVNSFDATELERFLMHRPVLQEVRGKIGKKMGLQEMVDVTIDFCRHRALFDYLLEELENYNPVQYNRYAHKLF